MASRSRPEMARGGVRMWYVVQTMAGREFAVQRQIEQFASDDVLDECFVPQY